MGFFVHAACQRRSKPHHVGSAPLGRPRERASPEPTFSEQVTCFYCLYLAMLPDRGTKFAAAAARTGIKSVEVWLFSTVCRGKCLDIRNQYSLSLFSTNGQFGYNLCFYAYSLIRIVEDEGGLGFGFGSRSGASAHRSVSVCSQNLVHGAARIKSARYLIRPSEATHYRSVVLLPVWITELPQVGKCR
jgi:hypothetical protein